MPATTRISFPHGGFKIRQRYILRKKERKKNSNQKPAEYRKGVVVVEMILK